ncbi:MAG: hypothetical protein HC896_09160 [Bacteroidales bacterium]|nr:hypothetical protein [Bacteroidales bacterium]
MSEKNDKLRDACLDAVLTLEKIGNGEYDEIKDKLNFCIGSYNHDRNPVGLVEFGQKALEVLKEIKKQNPRKFKKDIIDNLEKLL